MNDDVQAQLKGALHPVDHGTSERHCRVLHSMGNFKGLSSRDLWLLSRELRETRLDRGDTLHTANRFLIICEGVCCDMATADDADESDTETDEEQDQVDGQRSEAWCERKYGGKKGHHLNGTCLGQLELDNHLGLRPNMCLQLPSDDSGAGVVCVERSVLLELPRESYFGLPDALREALLLCMFRYRDMQEKVSQSYGHG